MLAFAASIALAVVGLTVAGAAQGQTMKGHLVGSCALVQRG